MAETRREVDGYGCVEQGPGGPTKVRPAKGVEDVYPNRSQSPQFRPVSGRGSSVSRAAAYTALAGLMLAAALTGCTTTSRREAYFKSRADIVAGTPGNGEIRVATWPLTWTQDTALAFRDPDRLTDVGTPVPPID